MQYLLRRRKNKSKKEKQQQRADYITASLSFLIAFLTRETKKSCLFCSIVSVSLSKSPSSPHQPSNQLRNQYLFICWSLIKEKGNNIWNGFNFSILLSIGSHIFISIWSFTSDYNQTVKRNVIFFHLLKSKSAFLNFSNLSTMCAMLRICFQLFDFFL